MNKPAALIHSVAITFTLFATVLFAATGTDNQLAAADNQAAGRSIIRLPAQKSFADFSLIKVSPDYNQLDYIALMQAKDFIHATLGNRDWPADDLTLEQNKITLVDDLKQFERGENFTFHIFNREKTQIIGCLYLTPDFSPTSDKITISGFYWLIPAYQKSELDNALAQHSNQWLSELDIDGLHLPISFPLN